MSSLKGAVLDGYVVGEVLGSGASGLLYEAVHEATGRQAIVRVAGADGDDARLVEVFAREAAGLLVGEGRAVVRRTQAADGRALLLLEKVAPGEGHTEYSVTERLPDVGARRRGGAVSPSRRVFAVVVGAALVLGIAGAGVVAWAFTSTSAQVPLAVETARPVVEATPQPLLPDTSTRAPDATADAAPAGPVVKADSPPTRVAAKPPAGSPAMAAKPARPSAPAATPAKSAVPAACLNLETWRAGMRRELTALETYVARDDALADDFERQRAGLDYLRVTDAAGCARLEKVVDAFYAKHGLAR